MAITRQVITSLQRDGTDMLGTRSLAVKIVGTMASFPTVPLSGGAVIIDLGALRDNLPDCVGGIGCPNRARVARGPWGAGSGFVPYRLIRFS